MEAPKDLWQEYMGHQLTDHVAKRSWRDRPSADPTQTEDRSEMTMARYSITGSKGTLLHFLKIKTDIKVYYVVSLPLSYQSSMVRHRDRPCGHPRQPSQPTRKRAKT